MNKFLLAAALALLTSPVLADPFASDWSRGQKATTRLILVGQPQGLAQAGLEIALDPKTHTYWRVPGDAGVPPMLTFEGSTNLASAELLFPVPKRIVEDNATVYGYESQVLFPLVITPKDATKPVTLAVKLDFAACERTCVPEHAELKLELPVNGAAGPYEAALAAAQARVPQLRPAGAPGPLAILGPVYSADRNKGAVKPHFAVDVRLPPDAKKVVLLPLAAEGWYLSIEPIVEIGSGLWRFPVSVEEMPKDAVTGMIDTSFVLVADAAAIDVKTPLDASRLKP